MNCKKDDLAIVVWSYAGHEGKIVRCVRGYRKEMMTPTFTDRRVQDVWDTEPPLINITGVVAPCCDDQLRPIRDPGEDARDETLSWLPVPAKETA